MVSAKDSLDSKVNMLVSGADDYLTKPFEIQELMARIGVQIRKASPPEHADAALMRYKDLVLYTSAYTAEANGTDITLTKQEFRILELLMSNPGRAYSKQEIYDYAWDDYYIGEDKTINVHISNIRKKLRNVSDHEYIDTVWGIGFRLAR